MEVTKHHRKIHAYGKHLYLSILFRIVGKALQAATRIDKELAEEIALLPENFSFSLEAGTRRLSLFMQKDTEGILRYRGSLEKHPEATPDLRMMIKNIEAAILLFTFQERTVDAAARDRMVIDGNIPDGCTIVRILNRVEIYLLPAFLAKKAVRRYEKPKHKLLNRMNIYLHILIGR